MPQPGRLDFVINPGSRVDPLDGPRAGVQPGAKPGGKPKVRQYARASSGRCSRLPPGLPRAFAARLRVVRRAARTAGARAVI